MNTFKAKTLFSMALAVMLLAGCASTETDDSALLDEDDMSAFDGSAAQREAAARAEAERRAQEEAARLETVFYFGFDQSSLTPETRRALDAQIARLKQTSGTIRLEGHTDERGSREYNIALGERRARSIADYMVLNGIPRHRILTVSYGEERPAVMGQNEAAWAKNRRVELK